MKVVIDAQNEKIIAIIKFECMQIRELICFVRVDLDTMGFDHLRLVKQLVVPGRV